MKTLKIIMILLVVSVSVAMAQSEEALKKLDAARIALISERLNLSPEQAEKFWPLYREYLDRNQQLRKDYLSFKNSLGDRDLSETESKALVERGLQLKEKQLDLERNYSDRLNKVISNQQLLQLRKTEEDFKKMLLERMNQRGVNRERLERRDENKRNNF